MSNKLRRYEVLLPVRLNDGQQVPNKTLAEALNEIVDRFGAASLYKDAAEGTWVNEGVVYRDQLALIIVDIPDSAPNRKWMKAYKARWKARLDQIDLWVVSYRIDVE